MDSWRDRARTVMLEKGLSQDWLAGQLGMTQGGVQHWLSGKRHPTLEAIQQIATILEVPTAYLTAGVEADEVLTDLAEPARSVLRTIAAKARAGKLPPDWFHAILALAVSQSADHAAKTTAPLGAPIAADHADELQQLSIAAERHQQYGNPKKQRPQSSSG